MNIDALDSCQEMLDKSKQYGAYTNYINAYLGKNRLPIEDGKSQKKSCYNTSMTSFFYIFRFAHASIWKINLLVFTGQTVGKALCLLSAS